MTEAHSVRDVPQRRQNVRTTGSGEQPLKRNGMSSLNIQALGVEARESLEAQASALIARVRPSSNSVSVREAVFQFMQRMIVDCFSEYPVRSCKLDLRVTSTAICQYHRVAADLTSCSACCSPTKHVRNMGGHSPFVSCAVCPCACRWLRRA
jgi:hypothetical protein